jgi:hypothetical protein
MIAMPEARNDGWSRLKEETVGETLAMSEEE